MRSAVTTATQPLADLDTPVVMSIRTLAPLWRHAAWVAALFAVCMAAVAVRLDVAQLRKDMDRNTRLYDQAETLHQRLQLELGARRRAVAVEDAAKQMQMTGEAHVVRVPEPKVGP